MKYTQNLSLSSKTQQGGRRGLVQAFRLIYRIVFSYRKSQIAKVSRKENSLTGSLWCFPENEHQNKTRASSKKDSPFYASLLGFSLFQTLKWLFALVCYH